MFTIAVRTSQFNRVRAIAEHFCALIDYPQRDVAVIRTENAPLAILMALDKIDAQVSVITDDPEPPELTWDFNDFDNYPGHPL